MHGSFFEKYGLRIILISFFFLAATGLFYNFGLATTVGDETPPFVAALKMIGNASIRPAFPTFYYMPLPAYAELPFAAISLLALPFFGIATTFDSIREFVILDFPKLLPAARFASVVYATLALFLFYRLALRIFWDKRPALLSTYFLATSLLFFQLAHFGKVWSLQLLAITYALWSAFALNDKTIPEKKRYARATLGIVVSFGVNVIGATVYAAFFAAHFLRMKGRAFREILTHRPFLAAHFFLLASVGLFYWLNPYSFANYLGHVATPNGNEAGAYCVARFGAWSYYPETLFGYGPVFIIIFFFGVSAFFRLNRRASMILGSFALTYLAMITALSLFGIIACEPRYAAPLLLPLALAAGYGASRLLLSGGRKEKIILSALLLATLALPVLYDMKLTLPSTRTSAREWILGNIPDGAQIITLDEKLDLPENKRTLEIIQKTATAHWTVKRAYLFNHPEKITVPSYTVMYPDFFTESASVTPEYLILSWWTSEGRAKNLRQAKGFDRIARFGNENNAAILDLPNNMERPATGLWKLKQNGPTIEIYRRP